MKNKFQTPGCPVLQTSLGKAGPGSRGPRCRACGVRASGVPPGLLHQVRAARLHETLGRCRRTADVLQTSYNSGRPLSAAVSTAASHAEGPGSTSQWSLGPYPGGTRPRCTLRACVRGRPAFRDAVLKGKWEHPQVVGGRGGG